MALKVDQNTTQNGETKDPLERTGRRPRFHALWHLKALGVVDDLDTFKSEVWKTVDSSLGPGSDIEPVRVVVIDTLPAFTHPNLAEAIDFDLARDFSRNYNGEEIRSDLSFHHSFGAHGTSVAGLIAARPQQGIKLREPKDVAPGSSTPPRSNRRGIDLPYCGINPFAKIVPVVVSAAPSPEMLCAALDYAASLNVGDYVVVIADSWDRAGSAYEQDPEDPMKEPAAGIPTAYGSKVARDVSDRSTSEEDPLWLEVKKALDLLSREAFVFCAAGNEPRSSLVFPASLSQPTTGPWAIGACDLEGNDLTYTPNSEKVRERHRLITTLSSEHPRFDKVVQKLDPWAKVDKELDLPDWLFDKSFQPFDIVAIDVPGPAGYNPSPYDHIPAKENQEHLDIASLFCRFSGTSAATALAAGLVSLALARRRAEESTPHDGVPYMGEAGLFTLERAEELIAGGLPK